VWSCTSGGPPSACDTPIWDTVAGQDKPARLNAMAARLLTGRVGTPVVHMDDGQRLV
jgi:hypothetical protein